MGTMAKRVPRAQRTHPAILGPGLLGSVKTKKANPICRSSNAAQIQARKWGCRPSRNRFQPFIGERLLSPDRI
jgi:hypothetical protein